MSRLALTPSLPKNEAKANEILAEARIEYIKMQNAYVTHQGKWHGLAIRFRNRLVKEAGYSYNEAYHAYHGMNK